MRVGHLPYAGLDSLALALVSLLQLGEQAGIGDRHLPGVIELQLAAESLVAAVDLRQGGRYLVLNVANRFGHHRRQRGVFTHLAARRQLGQLRGHRLAQRLHLAQRRAAGPDHRGRGHHHGDEPGGHKPASTQRLGRQEANTPGPRSLPAREDRNRPDWNPTRTCPSSRGG